MVLEVWEEKLLQYLKNNAKIMARELSAFWNVSKRTARTRIRMMVEDGKVVEFASGPFDPKKYYSLST